MEANSKITFRDLKNLDGMLFYCSLKNQSTERRKLLESHGTISFSSHQSLFLVFKLFIETNLSMASLFFLQIAFQLL